MALRSMSLHFFFFFTETVLPSKRSLYEVLSVNVESPTYFVSELPNPRFIKFCIMGLYKNCQTIYFLFTSPPL
jgi:hypothetical protein